MSMRPCVLFVANRGYALSSSRSGIMRSFLRRGWKVVIVVKPDEYSEQLEKMGVVVEPVFVSRGGLSLLGDLGVFLRLLRLYRKYRPVFVHHFHAKPVILGGVAAYIAGVPAVSTITGLGHAFIKGRFIRKFAGLGYRFSLRFGAMTIFQNRDDYDLFLNENWVPKERACLIIGSGVDCKRFAPGARDKENPKKVVLLARLLWQKGIKEFAQVAELVRAELPGTQFVLAGEVDALHPDSVPEDWVNEQDSFEYVGRLSDVRDLLGSASVLLFPSYREGVPRAVLEASASGVPIVAFDVPGVREAVVNGETGYLVPFGDVDALATRTCELLRNNELNDRMSQAGRLLVTSTFDIEAIENRHDELYRSLGFI